MKTIAALRLLHVLVILGFVLVLHMSGRGVGHGIGHGNGNDDYNYNNGEFPPGKTGPPGMSH